MLTADTEMASACDTQANFPYAGGADSGHGINTGSICFKGRWFRLIVIKLKRTAALTMIPRTVILFFVELEFGPFTAPGTAQRYWHNAVHVEQQDRYADGNGQSSQHRRYYDLEWDEEK